MIASRKYTNTFIPNDIKRYHFTMQVFNAKTMNDLTDDEIQSAINYFDSCAEKIAVFKSEFLSQVKPETNEPV